MPLNVLNSLSSLQLFLLGWLVVAIVVMALAWAVARWWLSGPPLTAFDGATGPVFSAGAEPSDEHQRVVASLGAVKGLLQGVPLRQQVPLLRKYMDEVFAPQPDSAVSTASFIPANAAGVDAEWVFMPGADHTRRLLYIHGGAFAVGSARSHRRLTTEFARRTGGVVLAINYRMLPEHPRSACIEDCQTAYVWMLEHGPEQAGAAHKVWVAGDSAGGNLTLVLIAWVRDQGLRQPNAAVALSPATDATLASPSMRRHVGTDPMLGPLLGPLARVPHAVMLWVTWLYTRINPRDPRVSPVYGDLSRLPPVLVQSSSAEMLRDDACRYVNRARAAGSPVQLQTWDHMVHVWQIFHPELAEARQALDEIEAFLAGT